MNRFFFALPLLLCCAALAQEAKPPTNFVQPDPAMGDKLEKDARAFAEAAVTGSEAALPFWVMGGRPGFYGEEDWGEVFTSMTRLAGVQIDTVEVEDEQNNEATVTLNFHRMEGRYNDKTQKVEPVRGKTQSETLRFRRNVAAPNPGNGAPVFVAQRGAWQVVPLPVEEVLAKPFYETSPFQRAAVLATRDPRLLPFIRQNRALSQLKQLGLGVMQFSQDYDENFSFDDAGHERALRPYLKTDSLYTIAGTKDAKWHFNDNLSGQPLAKLSEVARTVLFYDGSAPDSEGLNFRFSDKTLIGFADGHCKALGKDELKDLIWKP